MLPCSMLWLALVSYQGYHMPLLTFAGKKYKNAKDDEKAQTKLFEDWAKKHFKPVLDDEMDFEDVEGLYVVPRVSRPVCRAHLHAHTPIPGHPIAAESALLKRAVCSQQQQRNGAESAHFCAPWCFSRAQTETAAWGSNSICVVPAGYPRPAIPYTILVRRVAAVAV